MVTVTVYYQSTGRPVKSQKVSIGFDGFFRGFSKDQYTDDKGECHFDNDPGTGTIYINGKTVYNGKIEGRTVIYI